MIVKGTKQLGNFKRGVNLYVPKRRSAAAPTGIPTATANSIILQSGDSFFGDNGCAFYKQSIEYFGDCGDVKLVFEGAWIIRGDNQTLRYYNSTPNQTANYFPTDNWYSYNDTLTPLVFVGT